MAQYSWTYDVSSGVYKNNQISKKIRQASIVDTVFQQFCGTEPGFGRHKGETVNLRRLKNLSQPTSAQLTENIPIPVDTFSTATTAITVVEWGRAVEYSSLAADLETFDVENGVQKALKNQ